MLVHGYMDVNLDRVWSVTQGYVDPLDQVARRELRDLDARQDQGSGGGDR